MELQRAYDIITINIKILTMGTMTCHGMCHGTGNISLEVLLSAGVAIRHGGGIFSVLASCVESWRVRTWGELFGFSRAWERREVGIEERIIGSKLLVPILALRGK